MTGWGLHEGEAITEDLVAVRRLGGGATYEAYLAFDEVTWGPVVAKLVRPDLVEDASSLRGLRREAEALTTVNHPVVVRALRWTDSGPHPHPVLENLDGPRLSTLVRRHGRLQPQQYLVLGIELASALHYLRRLGWVHLDVKPSNIIMGAPARLIDLSVARTIEDAARLKHVIGTDRYLAPEQADPGRAGVPSPASDVWGLAAVLFEAVSGVRPFRDGDPSAELPHERHPQLVEGPAALPGDVPAPVREVILAGLSPEPADRPLPHEVSEALEPVLHALPAPRLAGWRS
jgi:eukaryotic-like serine/threonine-protein kinase